MIRNYLKTASRAFKRGKVYSAINLIGLSLGTAVVLLLSLYINDEMTYDSFHQDADLIYRPWVKEHYQGDVFFNTITPYILGAQLKAHLPEIELMARYTTTNASIKNGTEISNADLYLVEPDFLNIFNFPLGGC